MKKIFTLFSFCIMLNLATAQTVAPDFTVTTTHGETFNLYETLDQGKTVVIDIFFVNCPPCNAIAPDIQQLNMEWGDGQGDVVFLSLTDVDTNAEILPYEEMHSLTFSAAGRDNGGTEACSPYVSGQFGQFFGYPTISVIAPDKTLDYDLWGGSDEETISLIDASIVETGASKDAINSTYESEGIAALNAFPNPVINDLQVTFELVESTTVEVTVVNTMGQIVSEIQTGKLSAGEQMINIDMEDLANGLYIVELKGDKSTLANFTVTK